MMTRPFPPIFFLMSFLITLFIGWPGVMRPDSVFQLSQALSGAYVDHHPPLMAMYWGLLNKIWPGPGLMLVTHLGMLWGASYLFFLSCGPLKIRAYFFLFPFMPAVFVYVFFILKDVGFAFSFLLALSVIAYQNYLAKEQKKPSLFLKGLGFSALIYGVGVKYQALFLAPVIVYGLLYRGSFPRLKTVLVSGGLIFSLPLFNGHFSVPSHAWQWVKLYDLTGITLRINQDLIPDFNRNGSLFSLKSLNEKYNACRVDALIDNKETSPLKVGKNDEERSKLWRIWARAVLNHPGAYFDHRWALFKNLVTTSPFKTRDQVLSCHDLIPDSLFKIMTVLAWARLDHLVQTLLMPVLWFPVMVIYFMMALWYRREYEGQTVLFLTTIGLMLPAILFVFSMASDARYVYLSLCCLHGCHPFIWILYRKKCRLRRS